MQRLLRTDQECAECGRIGQPVFLGFDDPDYGVAAGYFCNDQRDCENHQEGD